MNITRFCAVQVVQCRIPAVHSTAVFQQQRDTRKVHSRNKHQPKKGINLILHFKLALPVKTK